MTIDASTISMLLLALVSLGLAVTSYFSYRAEQKRADSRENDRLLAALLLEITSEGSFRNYGFGDRVRRSSEANFELATEEGNQTLKHFLVSEMTIKHQIDVLGDQIIERPDEMLAFLTPSQR